MLLPAPCVPLGNLLVHSTHSLTHWLWLLSPYTRTLTTHRPTYRPTNPRMNSRAFPLPATPFFFVFVFLRPPPGRQLHLMSFFYEKTKSIGAGTPGKEFDEGEDESTMSKLKKHASLVCSLSEDQLVRSLSVAFGNLFVVALLRRCSWIVCCCCCWKGHGRGALAQQPPYVTPPLFCGWN